MIHDVQAAQIAYSTPSSSTQLRAASAVSQISNKTGQESEPVIVELSNQARETQKLLSDLPPLIFDPAVQMQNAENRLKELMRELAIPEGSKVEITSRPDGTFSVEGDHPLLSKIEQSLNDGNERELRNSLIGAHTGTMLQRIGSAIEQAMLGVDANPEKIDSYYGWVRAIANEAKAMDFAFSLESGSLEGSLINNQGQRIAANQNLNLPTG